MSMNIKRAVAKVAENNPRAIWYAVEFFNNEPDVFEIFDFTFSDEIRSRIGSYDCCTETLFDSDGTELSDSNDEERARLASAMAAVNELSKSMDPPTGRNYPAWNARKQEAAAKRRMNSKPEDR